jgi:predicted O-linked N-acetylglucosamine transferase (SPINDLY family)
MARKSRQYTNPFLKVNGAAPPPISSSGPSLQQALALHRRGDFQQAEAIYLKLLTINPANSEALQLLGAIALEKGNNQDALELISLAIEINPKVASYHSNQGVALKELNKFEEAVASFDKAIFLEPSYAEAYSNRGAALRRLHQLDAAIASCEKALSLKPSLVSAYSNIGLALQEQKKLGAAILIFDKAVSLKPNYYQAYSNRGNALLELKQFDAAIASYDKAISLRPDFAEAYYNRGAALKELKQLDSAIESYDKAFSLKPDHPYLLGMRQHLKMLICDWEGFESNIQLIKQKIQGKFKATSSFTMIGLPVSLSDQRQTAENWYRDKFPGNSYLGPIVQHQRQAKIRLGYFSADFHNHATAYLMAELFERHDKSKFELIAFSFGPETKDEMQLRVSQAFDHFINVANLSDLEVALLSRELGIDIAIDLKGVTQDARLGIFSYRAAPIQVSYLGYPGTLGADYIDYLIADKTLIPPQSQQHYSEKIVYLPNSYQVNDRHRVIAPTQFTKKELGLPEDAFVFCCFNNNFKITPDIFDSWVRILKAVEDSVLWLLQDNPTAAMNLQKEAVRRGLDPARLVFAERMDLSEHLARHKVADLFLDTTPCNAHTTASDALWAGLPLLTCMGESFASRVAASLLNAIGLPELVTETQDQYEALAIDLAKTPDKLKNIKDKLERNRLTTPLFDTALFTKHIEAAYIQIYERYQANLSPKHIEV